MTAEEYFRTLSQRESVDKPEALELLELYMREHGLEGWRAKIYKREPVVQAGRCYVEAKLIWLNEWCIYDVTPAKLRERILHEIAHALVPYDFNHGKAWEAKALELGLNRKHIRETRKALEEARRAGV